MLRVSVQSHSFLTPLASLVLVAPVFMLIPGGELGHRQVGVVLEASAVPDGAVSGLELKAQRRLEQANGDWTSDLDGAVLVRQVAGDAAPPREDGLVRELEDTFKNKRKKGKG